MSTSRNVTSPYSTFHAAVTVSAGLAPKAHSRAPMVERSTKGAMAPRNSSPHKGLMARSITYRPMSTRAET